MIHLTLFFGLLLTLSSCSSELIQPFPEISNTILQSATSSREPSLGRQWLALIGLYKGKERVDLINLRSRKRVPLPGLNRQDSQPISISVSADGEQLALIRQRESRTELLIYRRRLGAVKVIEINPKGIPKKVTISGSGKLLAVQVSRNGYWEVDFLRLSN